MDSLSGTNRMEFIHSALISDKSVMNIILRSKCMQVDRSHLFAVYIAIHRVRYFL